MADEKTQEEIIAEAVAEATAGLKATNEALKAEKTKLSNDAKRFDGIDPDEVRTLKKNLSASKEAQLIADGKVDEALALVREGVSTDYEAQLGAIKGNLAERDSTIDGLKGSIHALTIESQVAEAFAGSKGHRPEAIADVKARARGVFSIGDDGKRVAKKPDGTPWLNGSGEYIDPGAWLEDAVRKDAPYYWKGSGGADDPGGPGDGGGGPKTMTLAEHNALQKSDPVLLDKRMSKEGWQLVD